MALLAMAIPTTALLTTHHGHAHCGHGLLWPCSLRPCSLRPWLAHQALQHDNRTLRALELSHNPLGRKGTGVVMASLADNLQLTSVGLQHTMAGLDGVRDKMAHGEASGAGASLDFDAQRPEGEYSLELGKPWERWVACKLQQLSLQQNEPWENCSYDDGRTPHFSRHSAQSWSEKLEVPTSGHLRLRYRSTQPVEQSLVHYSLDLADPAQREVLVITL